MALGGIAIAMINLIANLKDEYDIELLLINHGGELESRLPSGIKIHYLDGKLPLCDYTKKTILKAPFSKMATRLFYELLCRIFPNRMIMRRVAKREKSFGKYDVVINNNMDFRRGAFCGACHNYTIHRAEAKKKFIIIHGDFIKNKYNTEFAKREYARYDKIICVSEALANQVRKEMPESGGKIESLYNFQDVDGIKALSREKNVSLEGEGLKIISVSRLSEVKGYMRSLAAFEKLMKNGYKFCWHIIGSGEDRNEMDKFIEERGMSGCVKLHGALSNPFPYVKAADLMYLGSYHESYGLVLIEAMILGVPSLSTEVLPARELLDGLGYVCENNEQGIYQRFVEVFENENQLKKFREKLKDYKYDNESIKKKFREFVNE